VEENLNVAYRNLSVCRPNTFVKSAAQITSCKSRRSAPRQVRHRTMRTA